MVGSYEQKALFSVVGLGSKLLEHLNYFISEVTLVLNSL